MRDKTNAIEYEFHGFICDMYDKIYKLSTLLESCPINSDDNYNDDYINKGFILFRDCETKFYTPELYSALIFGDIDYYEIIYNDDDEPTKQYDDTKYIQSYMDAFKDGKQNFNDEIKGAGINGTQERVIYLQGWLKKCDFIFNNPEILMLHIIKGYGYYAGIFTRIIELIDNDSRLQQRIKDLTGDDFVLQQQIEKLVHYSLDAGKPILLIKNLKKNQQEFLYRQLTEKGTYLDEKTDYQSFCYVFGNSVKPDNFSPLKWMQNRQVLRILITELKHPDISITKSKYSLPPYFIDKNDKQLKELPNNKAHNDNIFEDNILQITKKLRLHK